MDAPAETGRAFDVNLDLDGNIGVGVGQMDEDGSIRIVRDGNGLTIYSPAGCDMEVYAVDGRLVEVLRSRQKAPTGVDTLARGVYVINGERWCSDRISPGDTIPQTSYFTLSERLRSKPGAAFCFY